MQLVQRIGIEPLHELCVEARELGRTRVHLAKLLAATGTPGFDPLRPNEIPEQIIAVDFGELTVGVNPLLPTTMRSAAPELPQVPGVLTPRAEGETEQR